MYLMIITAIQCQLKQLNEWQHCKHVNIVPFLELFHREGNVLSLVVPYYEIMDVMNYLRSNPQLTIGLCTILYTGMAINCMVSLWYRPILSPAHTHREMGGWWYGMYPYVAVYGIMV